MAAMETAAGLFARRIHLKTGLHLILACHLTLLLFMGFHIQDLLVCNDVRRNGVGPFLGDDLAACLDFYLLGRCRLEAPEIPIQGYCCPTSASDSPKADQGTTC